ncbi:n-alpha-acetyltransferase 50 [Anaeramoeba flamelloides]|uniref:N-alpha-acetyltransferase 50 n=1 Tax=Anaeramoeba flamelloides TaxID=1746091 RepID=A0ABQ8YTK1_9EUKA|nr:n-alpha-acetyltransferase 50 [Anaeramoeba flamelloides]
MSTNKDNKSVPINTQTVTVSVEDIKKIIKIRRIEEGDFEDLRNLDIELFGWGPRTNYYRSLLDSNLSCVAVSTKTNKIVGECTSRLEMYQDWKGNYKLKGYIMRLGVKKEYRHLGIGYNLLKKIVNTLLYQTTVSYVYLNTQANNTRAVTFYNRFGFAIVEMKKNMYKRTQPEAPDGYELVYYPAEQIGIKLSIN